MDRRADRPGEDLGAHVGHLVVAEGLDQQDLLGLDALVGVGGEVLRVAVVLAAVPEELDQLQARCTRSTSSGYGASNTAWNCGQSLERGSSSE